MDISLNVKQKIDAADIVSFDIFDTLLVRQTANPTDVFRIAHELLNQDSQFFVTEDFFTMRIEAEKQARRKKQRIDVTLYEIYSELKKNSGFTDELADALAKCELVAEEAVLIKNAHVSRMYDYAIKKSKTIVIVSDMYLSSKFLKKCLQKNGYTQWDKLIVSCEDNVGKYCGSAFAMLLKEYPDKKVMHVGDNEWSDIAWSSAFNMDNIHVNTNIEKVSHEKEGSFRAALGGDRYRHSINDNHKSIEDIQTNLLSGMAANYLTANHRSVAESIGYTVLGPLLVGFSQWIHATARENSKNHIFFLARDGAVMQRGYKALFGKDAVKSTYAYGSRRLLNFPGIFNTIGATELETLTSSDHSLDIAKTLRYFGISPEDIEVQAAFKKVGLDTNAIVKNGPDVDRVKAAFLIIQEKIYIQAAEERKVIVQYFDAIGLTGNTEKLLVCDIGWHGSMQKSINTLIGRDVSGIYFGIHNNDKTLSLNQHMIGYFDSRKAEDQIFEKTIDYGIEVIEFLFTNPNQASLVGIKQIDVNQFDAIEGDHDTTQLERELLISIQDAALDFVTDFKEVSRRLPRSITSISKKVAFNALSHTILQPSDVSAYTLGACLHSFTAGSVARYIGMPTYYDNIDMYKKSPHLLNQEFEDAFWKQGFLKNCERLGIQKFLNS